MKTNNAALVRCSEAHFPRSRTAIARLAVGVVVPYPHRGNSPETSASYTGQEPSKQFVALAKALKTVPLNQRGTSDPKKGLTLTEGSAPLLSIHTNEIALFPIASQKLLLNVSKEIGFYNQHVAYLRRLFDKTFDTLTEINRRNIQQNLEEGYEFTAQRAVRIADAIKAAHRR
jgi:hypothetical protein